MSSIIRAAALAIALLPATAALAGPAPAAPEATAGMKLVFADEFDRPHLLEGGPVRWNTTFFWGGRTLPTNKEEQLYVDPGYVSKQGDRPGLDPFEIRDGVLSIVARRASETERGALEGYRFTSGLITTHGSFTFRYGYVEARARVPRGQGFWPAIWLLDQRKPKLGEIDIMEIFGQKTRYLNTTLHWQDGGARSLKLVRRDVPDLADGFHTYGLLWTADSIVMYLDGREMGRAATPPQLREPMYLLLNLAVGGKFPGFTDATTPFPARFDIDYVRVWQSPEDVRATR